MPGGIKIPKYKQGKQIEQLEFSQVLEKMEAAKKNLSEESQGYFWLLYYIGCRKSELYERLIVDVTIKIDEQLGEDQGSFILDITKRKKGSERTPPIELPLWFPGMDVVLKHYRKVKNHKKKRKLLERWSKGKKSTSWFKARWLFPHVHRTWALKIVKTVLGEAYYPHFLRLNRITEIASDPGSNLTRIKSFTGIKSTQIIEENYMGVSKKEQKAAVDFIGKQIKKDKEKKEDENEEG
jgi:hypothetical protein